MMRILIIQGCKGFSRLTFLKIILMSICAASLIPLFLNTISSDLISESLLDDTRLLVLFGFCLLAGLYSERFIQSLSTDVLKLKKDVESLERNVEPIVSKETESFPEVGGSGIQINFDDDTKKVLRTLGSGKYTWRTGSGLAKELSMEKQTVLGRLASLKSKGLVVERNGNGLSSWWGLTSSGRMVFFGTHETIGGAYWPSRKCGFLYRLMIF